MGSEGTQGPVLEGRLSLGLSIQTEARPGAEASSPLLQQTHGTHVRLLNLVTSASCPSTTPCCPQEEDGSLWIPVRGCHLWLLARPCLQRRKTCHPPPVQEGVGEAEGQRVSPCALQHSRLSVAMATSAGSRTGRAELPRVM